MIMSLFDEFYISNNVVKIKPNHACEKTNDEN